MIFAHLSKVFIDVYRFNCMNSFNLYKFSGIFKYFDILKTNDVLPSVCPLIDHGSRPMKSHEFSRLLYKNRRASVHVSAKKLDSHFVFS